MHLLKGFAAGDQLHALTYTARDAVGDFRRKVLQRVVDGLTKPARGQFLVRRGFIDGHDAADFDGISGQHFGVFRGKLSLGGSVHQNLELRLDHLQPCAAEFALLHLSIESDGLSRLEPVIKISTAKPEAVQAGAALAGGHLKDGHLAGTEQT